ncbi:MAG: hypothetical protein HQK89_12040 [Nitrospirae bacterium]|nr:hypothetical protein [Nitrospirota bacterium]
MKKFLLTVLAFALALGLLSCGKKGPPTLKNLHESDTHEKGLQEKESHEKESGEKTIQYKERENDHP